MNLFSYADSDSDENDVKEEIKKVDKQPISSKHVNTDIDKEKTKAKPTSLFGSIPKAKKSKKSKISKKQKLMTYAKFAKVPLEELMKEFNEKPEEKTISKSHVKKNKSEEDSLLSLLPKPKEDVTSMTNNNDINTKEEHAVNTNVNEKKMPKPADLKKESEQNQVNSDDDEPQSTFIPLNPFLDDIETLKTEQQEKQEQEKKTESYSVVYNVPTTNSNKVDTYETKEMNSYEEDVPVYGYGTSQGGYSGNYSQKQYEAFMRQSGMLASANASNSRNVDFIGENSQYYDKQVKEAIENGNIIELNQNDIHDHSGQPGSEYWQKKEKRAQVASEFGKYAHMAPTQVQQTRHQITYLFSQAIDSLTDLDSRRDQMRKTKKETRAKYGW